jgi:hypothetical protein
MGWATFWPIFYKHKLRAMVSFLKITEEAQIWGLLFSTEKSYVLGWATFWAFFTNTNIKHLVTLFGATMKWNDIIQNIFETTSSAHS